MTRELVAELRLYLDEVQTIHERGIALYGRVMPIMQSSPTEKDAADIGYLSNELEKLTDESHKNANALNEIMAKVIGLMVVRRTTQDPTLKPKLQGELATATPDSKIIPLLPSTHSDEYRDICSALGITGVAVKEGIASLHFRKLADYLSELTAQGKPTPKLKTGVKFTCRYYKLKTTGE